MWAFSLFRVKDSHPMQINLVAVKISFKIAMVT